MKNRRPRTVTEEVEAEVVRLTLEERPPEGTRWSSRLLAKVVGLYHSQVQPIWKAHRLKPHRIRYFKLSTDPPAPAGPWATPRVAPSLYESPDGSGIGRKNTTPDPPPPIGQSCREQAERRLDFLSLRELKDGC